MATWISPAAVGPYGGHSAELAPRRPAEARWPAQGGVVLCVGARGIVEETGALHHALLWYTPLCLFRMGLVTHHGGIKVWYVVWYMVWNFMRQNPELNVNAARDVCIAP